MSDKSILGSSFDDFVDKQLDVRVKKLSGEGSRGLDFTAYTTAKTAFLRLTSGVDISEEKATILGNPNWKEDNLAKAFVLQAGTVNMSGSFSLSDLKYGLTDENSAYRVGGISDFGLRPMPGITSMTVKSRGRWGSLREAEVRIKCYNRDQLSIIEALYLRPGYTILLEWGHTIFYNNEERLVTDNSVSFIDFFQKGIERKTIYESITQKQQQYGGNYDAFIGPVANFSINTQADGTYDCSLKAFSWGYVIESLKINSSPSSIINKNPSLFNAPNIGLVGNFETTSPEQENLEKSKLSSLITSYYKTCNSDRFNDGKNHRIFIKDIYNKDFDVNQYGNSINTPPTLINSSSLTIFPTIPFKISSNQNDNVISSDLSVYMSLGSLLSVISKNCLIYNISNTSSVAPPKIDPICNIDFNTETNVCFSPKYHVSVDPNICLIKFWRGATFKIFNTPNETYSNPTLESYLPDFKIGNSEVGRTMNIMLNINYILTTLETLESNNVNREVYLLGFLEKIMEGVTLALGKINDFFVGVDDETNTLTINDRQIMPDLTKKNISVINTTGLKSSVRNIRMNTRVSNELASIIAIGAQASGVSLGVDASVLSEYNEGLTDRCMPNKHNYNSLSEAIGSYDDYVRSLEKDIRIIKNLSITLNNIYNKRQLILEDIDLAKNFYADICNTLKSKSNVKGTQIIPFTFDIKMDGLSGIKYGQVFSIEPSRLPKTYLNPDDLSQPLISFLVTGIDHEIVNNTWLTDIVGQAAPLRDYKIKVTNG